jgi:hypothetical protein
MLWHNLRGVIFIEIMSIDTSSPFAMASTIAMVNQTSNGSNFARDFG